jgi:hypothetical protein
LDPVELKGDPGEEAVLPGVGGGFPKSWHVWLGCPVPDGFAAEASPVEKISRQTVPVISLIF